MDGVTPAVDAHDLYRFFHAGEEETLALRGVSLQVEAGEIVAVTGPSGSGKSTLLACLAGLDDPDGGGVRIAGQPVSRRPERERAAVRANQIGVLFQAGNLIDHLTVHDNVVFAQRLARHARRSRPAPDALLERVGLAKRAGATPPQLSGGEATRAAIAVAVANAPLVILADEPTGELDDANEDRVLALLSSMAGDGAAVVIVTHSATVAGRADREIRLRDGCIVP
jgi:putative ABC transport system ATP-binding protein